MNEPSSKQINENDDDTTLLSAVLPALEPAVRPFVRIRSMIRRFAEPGQKRQVPANNVVILGGGA